MSRFRFPFNTLRKVRKIDEDEKHLKQMKAKADLSKHLQYIQSLYNQIDQTRKEILNRQNEGKSSSFIQPLNDFIEGQKIRIEQQRLKARELMKAEEEAAKLYRNAFRQRKVIDLLFEKKLAEHKKKEDLKETKSIEDVVTMRYRGPK